MIEKSTENDDTIKQLEQYYINTLMSLFIVKLCKKRITLNARAKKVYLLCPDSFKSKKSGTKIALQMFADKKDEGCDEMKYFNQFPNHRKQCIDYFKV